MFGGLLPREVAQLAACAGLLGAASCQQISGRASDERDHEVAWEVVELPNPLDLHVQSGDAVIAAASRTATAAVAAVDLGRSFVLASFRVASASTQRLAPRLVRADLTSSTRVTFERADEDADYGVPQISWQVGELGAPFVVTPVAISFAAGSSKETIAMPVDPARAFAMSSVMAGGGQNAGSTSYTADDVLGVCAVTLSLTGTQLVAERSHTAGTCRVSAFVVQLPPVGAASPMGAAEPSTVCPP